jgi:hypothetical protein
MISRRRIEHRFVDDIPEQLDPSALYVSMRYATAVHLCCCGCGREVVTPLSPAQWRLTFDGESVSLYPSIGSWNLPCRSHYIISSGNVIEAPSWSDEEVAYGQVRDKRARTAHHVAKANAQLATEPVKTSIPIERWDWLTSICNFFTGRR